MNNEAEVTLPLIQIIQQTKTRLSDVGIEASAQEARMLVSHAFGLNSTELISRNSDLFSQEQNEALQALVSRRIAGEPVGRIIGRKEFFGYSFRLSKETLEPRSDTELLVEEILKDVEDNPLGYLKILDIGTGTGAIAISLLDNIEYASAIASDISAGALAIAKQNANDNGVEKRLVLVNTSWCDGIGGPFDIIVSNPPYIRTEVLASLAVEVQNHDPMTALDGGEDGLSAYREILTQAYSKLTVTGRLYLEIGFDQHKSVCNLAEKLGWNFVRLAKDYSGNDRVLVFDRSSG